MSSKKVQPDALSAAIANELTIYGDGVRDAVNKRGEETMKKLVKLTRANAPVGARHGSFKRHITSRADDAGHGMKKYTWYVSAPDHRLTHLLVHGHATRDGGRTSANPFLQNALNQVLPEYEKNVEEACRNGK